ncbi:cytochrome P450 4C1-like [Penaeus chinensis]|uniref:cytochrome P450 4C1-like n=1 Tax=Penaeus chinensis TaxID=139456 RepID=UPI001FB627C0|nr:cytochrome P450 4C1-like [Penaeus chinensis]
MSWLKSDTLVWASSASTYLALTAALALTFAWLLTRQRKSLLLAKLPGPKTHPIFGNSRFGGGTAAERMQWLINNSRLGEVVRLWIGFVPLCMICSARGAEVILASQRHTHKGASYDLLRDWLGDGLLLSTGSKWHSRRKLLTPAFHFKILEDFLDVFNGQSTTMIQQLRGKADGKPFDIFPFITRCALDIISETAMGRTVNAQGSVESAYVKALDKFANLYIMRSTTPWLRPAWLYYILGPRKERDACLKVLHGVSYETIAERKALREKSKDSGGKSEPEDESVTGKKKRLAFLDLLLEYSEGGAKLSDNDIREEVDTFMFEGHDTTTAAMNWVLYLLGHHPEIQARVHEELESIFGDEDRPATMDDLRSMKLLENCIKESLRLFPSVQRFGRILHEDVRICDYVIPAGTNIMLFPYRIHRDPKQFPDPERFDPDRFLPENSKHRHPYAYIPFSAGPRNCIGQKFAVMEEKVLLSSILRKFRVESTVPREDLKLLDNAVLRPKGGNILKVFPRSLA